MINISDNFNTIESSVRDTLGSVVWSHKIQEKQADIYDKRFKWMETTKIVAASLTSAGILSLIFTDQLWIKLLSTIISFISVFVSAYFKSFDLQIMVGQHKAAANNLLIIRDELKLLILQIKLQKDDAVVLFEIYKDVVHKLDKIYDEAPKTTNKAVEMARSALNVKKDNTFFDAEIDSFLPINLRKGDETQ